MGNYSRLLPGGDLEHIGITPSPESLDDLAKRVYEVGGG